MTAPESKVTADREAPGDYPGGQKGDVLTVRLVQGPLGSSWLIIPRALTDAMAAGGGEAKPAFEAMMPMN